MMPDRWIEVDNYLRTALSKPDAALEGAIRDSAAAGIPDYSVTANEGKFLHLLARIHGSRRILEIGTLGGYSTIWLARALPADGKLVTLEIDPHHASVARANFSKAGVAHLVELRQGPASETLPVLAADDPLPFDLFFIDADKANNSLYFEWALKLSRPGSVIVVDNVVRNGAVIDPHDSDPSVRGTRQLIEMVSAERRVSATALQTVGSKGYDGFLVALVIDNSSDGLS
jgi:predicted O-methyltransferase YrrM